MMATLAETQQLLWALITAPEGVAKALDDDHEAGGVQRRLLEHAVRSDVRLDAVARLDIYANMYFYRLLDALKDDYPALLAVVGEVTFHNLVTDYLLRHFPTDPSLRYAGRHLPDFLVRHPLTERYPFISDLAAFEWALIDAFDAPDAPLLSRDDLLAVPPARWAEVQFRLQPSVQLRTFGWGVHQVRQRVDAGIGPDQPAALPTRLRVWRQDLGVRYQAVGDSEWGALQVLASSGTFAAVCAADETDSPDTAARLATMLASWVADGLLTASTAVDLPDAMGPRL